MKLWTIMKLFHLIFIHGAYHSTKTIFLSVLAVIMDAIFHTGPSLWKSFLLLLSHVFCASYCNETCNLLWWWPALNFCGYKSNTYTWCNLQFQILKIFSFYTEVSNNSNHSIGLHSTLSLYLSLSLSHAHTHTHTNTRIILIVVLPCILISTKLFCQQMHLLLKHKMLQLIFKISFLIWLLHVSVPLDHHQGAHDGTLPKLVSLKSLVKAHR